METQSHIALRRRWWLYSLMGLTLAYLTIPSFIVVAMSFTNSTFLEFPPREWSLRWYRAYVESTEWRDATWISIKVAILTVLIATPLGTAAAYVLRVSEIRYKSLIGGLMVAPMLVPHILVAVGLFFTLSPLELTNTLVGLALAHAMLALPFVFVLVSAGLKDHDMLLEFAARSLGASRSRTFFSITLPQIRYSVIFGGLIALITSLDEVIVAMFLATGPLSTLTRRMFLSLRDAIDPTIAAISSLLILVSIIVVIVYQIFGQVDRP